MRRVQRECGAKTKQNTVCTAEKKGASEVGDSGWTAGNTLILSMLDDRDAICGHMETKS